MNEKLTKILEFAGYNKVLVFAEMPKGWGVIKGAMTAPRGSVWISNQKSIFSGEKKRGLLLLEEVKQ